MTATTKRDAMYERIRKHGLQLLAIFPKATERDPVKLCKRLRQYERLGNALGLRLCNGPEISYEEADEVSESILGMVDAILRFRLTGPAVILNRDPRGYALKINDEDMRGLSLHTDMGGYGILAPDLSEGE